MSFIGKKSIHNLTTSSGPDGTTIDPQRPIIYEPLPDNIEPTSTEESEDDTNANVPSTQQQTSIRTTTTTSRDETEQSDDSTPLLRRKNAPQSQNTPTTSTSATTTTTPPSTSPRPRHPQQERTNNRAPITDLLADEEVSTSIIRYCLLFIIFVVLFEITKRTVFPRLFGINFGQRSDEEIFRDFLRTNKLCDRGEQCEYDVSDALRTGRG